MGYGIIVTFGAVPTTRSIHAWSYSDAVTGRSDQPLTAKSRWNEYAAPMGMTSMNTPARRRRRRGASAKATAATAVPTASTACVAVTPCSVLESGRKNEDTGLSGAMVGNCDHVNAG